MHWHVMKRVFDIVAASAGLVVLLPVFLILSIAIKIDSPGPVFFLQTRIGKWFRPFLIYKFRTMVHDVQTYSRPITVGDDPRITRVGRFLRKTKLDELPQLVNVVKGDMTLVGPRPEVPHYVRLFRQDYEEILQVKPGITDLASIKYRDESGLLGRFQDPETEYVKELLPDKIRLAKEYIRRSSVTFDLTLILKTLQAMFSRRLSS